MNNPFDEYMGDANKIKDMTEELKKIAFLGFLVTLDLDPYIFDIFNTLIKHGCQVDTLIATLDELAKKYAKEDKPDDIVNHPSHYTDGSIEVIDFIEFWGLGFHLGNAVKYISRAGKKDPNKKIEDLEKALWYIRRAAGVPKEYRVFNTAQYYIREGKETISSSNYCADKGIKDLDLQGIMINLAYFGNQDDILELSAERLDQYIEKLKEESK